MLNANVTMFEIQLPNIEAAPMMSQVISGCNAYIGEMMSDDHRVYSELEEGSYAYLNDNDYHGKVLELDVCLRSNKENIYSDFYARCFAIRTDNGLRIKLNGVQNDKHISKVNMKNEVVIGVGWFLTDEAYKLLLDANKILIEGAFALNKPTNVYAMALQLIKRENGYHIEFANTYRMKNSNINNLAH